MDKTKKKPARKKTPRKKSTRKSAPAKPSRSSELLSQVIRLSGIPGGSLHQDLKSILDRKNIDENHLTLEQLRVVVASYLREIMGGLLDRNPEPPPSKSTKH